MTSASVPGFTQLLRLLGREHAIAALGAGSEPDPNALTEAQGATLRSLLEQQITAVAAELVQEAAASDDVQNAESARGWLTDRIADFRELIGSDLAARLLAAGETAIRDWE